jgi:outer membrane receptor protein involved in Fe transport
VGGAAGGAVGGCPVAFTAWRLSQEESSTRSTYFPSPSGPFGKRSPWPNQEQTGSAAIATPSSGESWIWDFRAETLFVARDRVGKKPLFYALTERGNFVFGSELKTLLTHGEIGREIDFAALDAYLTFAYVPESGGYTVVDLQLGYGWRYRDHPVHFQLGVTNLLDREYINGNRAWAAPREFTITTRVLF